MELKKIYTDDHCYVKYDGQCGPQDTYLLLDTDEGTVRADYNGEIGNAVPSRVWHGIDLRIPFDCRLKERAINQLMDDIADDLQIVLDGAGEEWDGSNWIGTLTDEARAALGRAEAYAADYGDPESDLLEIIGDDWWPSVREIAETCIKRGDKPADLIEEYLQGSDYDVCETDTDRLAELVQAEIDEMTEDDA